MPNTYTAIIEHHVGDPTSQVKESIAVPDGLDPETYVKELVDDFNKLETDRYGDEAWLRKFVSVDTTSSTRMCNWTRTNAVTLTDRKGMYNLYRCEECRLTVRLSEFSRPQDKECHPERVCTSCNKEYASEKTFAKHIARTHPDLADLDQEWR